MQDECQQSFSGALPKLMITDMSLRVYYSLSETPRK
jgi:hypothetical protein